jgi:hypothetical protein
VFFFLSDNIEDKKEQNPFTGTGNDSFDELTRLLAKIILWILIQIIAASPKTEEKLERVGHSKNFSVTRVT